ncbi:hypothetical protein Q5P01_007186 [Channa striata]|uniref:Uncharacterized protein n=1 Tax=Channa striata TaxID=64152 RepID=A0AA88N3H2_CHASR|nr:hypothetical protein Q5P01_007186 [Channa striata]
MERTQNIVICKNFCIYFAVVVIILVLGRDLTCTCKPQGFDCTSHVVLPFVIVFLFVLWTDRTFQRVCRHLCSSESGGRNRVHVSGFLGSSIRRIVQAAFISLLWVVFVFLEGSWFVCCMNDQSQQQAHLACKSEGSLTYDELIILAELKNSSRIIGTFLLFCIIGIPALLSSFGWRKPSSGDRKNLYHQLILEQEENVLKEILRQSARERLAAEMQDKIRGDQWEQCFDVAEELIKASTAPTVSERAQGARQQVKDPH